MDMAVRSLNWSKSIGSVAVALLLAVGSAAAPVAAQDPIGALIDRLSTDQQRELQAWREARRAYEAEASAYWNAVTSKRTERRKKIRAGGDATVEDYVLVFPPEYRGPKLSPALAELVAEEEKRAPDAPRPIPTVDDFLASAKSAYGFEPERISEEEFKRRYAREALALGLTRDQVLKVYALETGGQGTADMQSGINPITKQGRPISTALGYAQLLHANSVNELVKHGEQFIARLAAMAQAPGTSPARAKLLRNKQVVLRQMLAKARSVPNEWSDHIRLGGTAAGLGIHALNLDGDIGPWLQVAKLNEIRKLAANNGRPQLTGAELELMNLAGPATGLEMMTAVGSAMPTPNFFSRGGYERNPVVRGRTSAELLAELDKRMDVSLKRPGAVEFARIFDEVERETPGRR